MMEDKVMRSLRIVSMGVVMVAGLAAAGPACAAGPHEAPIREFANGPVREWVRSQLVIDAIREQNARHSTLTQSDIDAMDRQWRAETSAAERPMIERALANAVSQFLVHARDQEHGIVTEVFIMDNRGLNVGQSDATSDYWQGDEAKWQRTFLQGPGAMMIDDVELDESTQTFQSQLNMSITDPATGEVIGAITVGIDVESII